MRAGLLRDRVIILERNLVSDGYGGQTETWAELSTVPAMVSSSTLAGFSEPGGMASVAITQRVTMRYRNDVTDQDRLVWNGEVLDILDISPDAKQTRLIAICRKRIGESYNG